MRFLSTIQIHFDPVGTQCMAVACFISQLCSCSPFYLLGIDEIFLNMYYTRKPALRVFLAPPEGLWDLDIQSNKFLDFDFGLSITF